MEHYSFDNNLRPESAGTKLSNVNGFVAYTAGISAAFIKDNEGILIRFDDEGFVFFDGKYDNKISVEQYCINNNLELIKILTNDSNYHVSCAID